LWENVPGLEALLIITTDGNVIEHRTVPQYEKAYNAEWLKHFGSLISTRFQTGDIQKQFGGLDMTVNIFKDRTVLVSRMTNFDKLGSILSNYNQRNTA